MKELFFNFGGSIGILALCIGLIQRVHYRFDEYQRKDVCNEVQKKTDNQFNELRSDIKEIKADVKKILFNGKTPPGL